MPDVQFGNDLGLLSQKVRAVDPAARLIPARLLRRVIRRHFDMPSGARVPHGHCFAVNRDELLSIVDETQIIDGSAANLPARVLLLAVDDDGDDAFTPRTRELWRTLFHAGIDRAVDENGGSFADDPALFHATFRHEIQTVLEDADRILNPESQEELYREFVSLFLELHYFSPSGLPIYFPGLLHPEAVFRLLSERYGADRLFELTHLEGGHFEDAPKDGEHSSSAEPIPADHGAAARAPAALVIGNDVRAAILYRRAGQTASAHDCINHLLARFEKVVPLTDPEAWREMLFALLERATGFWPVSGRLLYEIQKACLDIERKESVVDFVEWFYTRGRSPLKRTLDRPRDIHVLKRLHTAVKFARRTRLTAAQREALDHLLHQAIVAIEIRVKRANRPTLFGVLDEVGVTPTNVAEQIARQTMVEELLDQLCQRGFLKMGDLRDAIARNRLKLDDLRNPGDFFHGSAILRANSRLAVKMPGLYRRGEIYLRIFQRGSSLMFGTGAGRLLFLYLLLPFGGAYVLLGGLHHFLEAIGDFFHFVERHILATAHARPPHEHHTHQPSILTSWPTIIATAFFLLALINWRRFRSAARKVGLIALVDFPTYVVRSAPARLLVDNALTRLFANYLLIPFIVGGLTLIALRLLRVNAERSILGGASAAVMVGLGFRTPVGRGLEERLDESLARFWRLISVNFAIGLVMSIVQFFTLVLEYLDKGIYAVDEWLTFREGESGLSAVFKFVFGTVWAIFAYLFRFAWNLLIEPQINPVKHFPVVTVSHKLLLPMVPSFAELFGMPTATMALIVSGIPGIFGFLVWELKENWRLFKANRPLDLSAIPVGAHGENVRAMLRPGLHSGAVPKNYSKWRRAYAAGDHARGVKIHHNLEHAGDALHHLANRQLAEYLRHSQRWAGQPIRVERIGLATNRVRVPLTLEGFESPTIISIEERGGWLIGSLEERGGVDRLEIKQKLALQDALSGFYKLAGVHVTREQAAAVLGIEPFRFDCSPEGLVILPWGDDPGAELEWWEEPVLRASAPVNGKDLGPVPAPQLVLSERPLWWHDWVERWEQDAAGKAPLEPLLGDYRVI